MTLDQRQQSRAHHLSREDCLTLLASQGVGRIVFVDPSGPMALPVNYTVDHGDVLVATSVHSSIARGASEAPVAFEVDRFDDADGSGWSVLIRGWAGPTAAVGRPVDPGTRPYAWPEGDRDYVVRIRPDLVSGRRLLPREGHKVP